MNLPLPLPAPLLPCSWPELTGAAALPRHCSEAMPARLLLLGSLLMQKMLEMCNKKESKIEKHNKETKIGFTFKHKIKHYKQTVTVDLVLGICTKKKKKTLCILIGQFVTQDCIPLGPGCQ